MIFPAEYTIASLFFSATSLNTALNPTVNDEMVAVTSIVIINDDALNTPSISKVRAAPKLPLTIPQMSPNTS